MANILRLRVARPSDFPGAPASVSAPVSGTPLMNVWNLQNPGATGPRTTATNAPYSGSLDAYLTGLGFLIRTPSDTLIFLDVGSGTKTVSNYDFSTFPRICIGGTGTCNFVDCIFPPNVIPTSNAGLTCPTDINGNVNSSTGTLTVNVSYSLLDTTKFYLGSGTLSFDHARLKNQPQNLGDVALNGLGAATLSIDRCYITGGGINAASGGHIELTQFGRNITAFPVSFFNCTNTIVDISKDGQTTTSNLAFWTAIWSVTDCLATYSNCIFIGATQVNANPNVPSSRLAGNPWHYYGQGSPIGSITNTVFDTGIPISRNADGGANRPTDGGGNRSYAANTAITSASPGWN